MRETLSTDFNTVFLTQPPSSKSPNVDVGAHEAQSSIPRKVPRVRPCRCQKVKEFLIAVGLALRLLPKQSTAGLTGGSYRSSVSNPSLKRQTTLVLQREPAEIDPWIVDMHIHICVDGENKTTTLARGLLDTQSDVSLISAKQVAALGLEHTVRPTNVMDPIRVYTLGKGTTSSITPKGSLPIRWHINKHEGLIYNEEFLVLPDALQPHFDFLISKHFIAQHQFLLRNPAVLYLRRARTGDLSAAR